MVWSMLLCPLEKNHWQIITNDTSLSYPGLYYKHPLDIFQPARLRLVKKGISEKDVVKHRPPAYLGIILAIDGAESLVQIV